MRLLIILVGLPGSGKSTLARQIAEGRDATISSADNYFVVNGEYRFDPTKLAAAHLYCRRTAEAAMATGKEIVIIDNTNVSSRERQPYVDLAQQYGYRVEYREPATAWAKNPEELARRNVHGVPQATIERMLSRLEGPVNVGC